MKTRVHFYGDSFTYGQGDPDGLGWVGRIAAKIPEVAIANHGVPGAPTSYVAEAFANTELSPDICELAVFCCGTNDPILRVPEHDTVATVSQVLDRAEERAVPVFWIGPPPIGELVAEDLELAELSQKIGEVAGARGVPFVATFDRLGEGSAWRAEAQAGDGSHPGAAGYAELAALLEREGLIDWITQRAAR